MSTSKNGPSSWDRVPGYRGKYGTVTQSTPNGIRGRGVKRGAWEGFAKSFCLGILVCVSRIERIAHAGKDMGQRVDRTTCEAHLLSVQALKGDGQEDSY